MGSRIWLTSVAAIAMLSAGLALASTAGATPGDIYATNQGGPAAVVRVDPSSGAQTVLLSGSPLVLPADSDFDRAGILYVTDRQAGPGGSGAVFRVDPATGSVTTLTSGGNLFEPTGIVAAPDGNLYVADRDTSLVGTSQGAVIKVDPATGAQTVLTSAGNLFQPAGIAVAPGGIQGGGKLIVADRDTTSVSTSPGRVILVDLGTGAQSVFSDGAGLFSQPTGVATGGALGPTAVIGDTGTDGTADGKILSLSASGVPSLLAAGTNLDDPTHVAQDLTGKLVATNFSGPSAVVRIDAGAASVLATGPNLTSPNGISVEPPSCFGRRATQVGGPAADTIVGTPSNDVLVGLAGKDKIVGKGGADRICGGPGNDKLKGGPGKDKLAGGGGRADICSGGGKKDVAKGCETKKSIP